MTNDVSTFKSSGSHRLTMNGKHLICHEHKQPTSDALIKLSNFLPDKLLLT